MENYYDILECDSKASVDTLKQAYQRLILKYHPDKLCKRDEAVDEAEAKDMFIKIDKAWKFLSDPEQRHYFDAVWKQRCQVMEWPVQDTIEEDELEFLEEENIYTFPCRCGNEYEISEIDTKFKVDYVSCPSCSLALRVIYRDKS